MNNRLKMTNSELSLMGLFESFTDVFPLACRVVEDNVFYVVDGKDYPKLIMNISKITDGGLRMNPGRLIKMLAIELSKSIGKKINISFYDGNLENFIRSFFRLNKNDKVMIKKNNRGEIYVYIITSPDRKGWIIGRGGVKAKIGRELASIFFGVKSISIK